MQDIDLPESERALLRAARAFAEQIIAPNAASWERDRQPLPRIVFHHYAALGLCALQVPRAHGGADASYLCKIGVAEIMARSCMAATFALNNAQGAVTRLAREGTDDQISRYLPGLMSGTLVCAPSLTEPGAGSDVTAMTTLATRTAGGWLLNGTKAWITNGAHADLLLLYAQTEPGAGASGIASFWVTLNAPGVQRHPATAMIGGSAIGAADITFTDLFVPDRDLAAAPGQAFKRAMAGITGARTHVAAMLNGIVAECLDRAVDHARARRSFGQRLLDHQGLRWMLADVATQLEASRLLTHRAATLIQQGDGAILAASQAKSFATDIAGPAVATCMQAMGAIGLVDDQPFARHLAATRIAAYVDGTTEMQRDRIGLLLDRHYGHQRCDPTQQGT